MGQIRYFAQLLSIEHFSEVVYRFARIWSENGLSARGPTLVGRSILILALLVCCPTANCDEAAVEVDLKSWVSVVDFVLEHHIDPPTRQQMILSGVKSLYRAESSVPPNLSRRVSALAREDEILRFLEQVRGDLAASDPLLQKDLFLDGVFDAVPGGGSILPADESRIQEQLAANRYVGIGIALTMSEGVPQISKTFYDGPGYREGVRDGDLILEIDGASTQKKDLGQIVSELRGAEGTDVRLKLKQAGEKPREITVTRGVTFIPTIEGRREDSPGKWAYSDEAHPDIAVLHFRQIGPSTIHELAKIESELRSTDLRGIVLDLRQAGGTLHDIVMLADKLLDEGNIGHLQSKDTLVTHTSLPGCLFKGIPMVVMIAENSGAGEVYLTAALQDMGRALVVGQPTQGETYVRSRLPLPGGDQIELATGLLQRGDGTVLFRSRRQRDAKSEDPKATSKPGFIAPDYLVQANFNSENSATADPWLVKAFEVLNSSHPRAKGKRDAETN